MSESVSAAEELIEKGARALWEGAVRNEYDYAWDLNQDQFKAQAAGFLAAVFGPGWREGISREWGVFDNQTDELYRRCSNRSSAEELAAPADGDTTLFVAMSRLVTGWQRVEGEQ